MLAERYDESPVPIWYIADPAHPEQAPTAHRYPVAGSADADVQLWYLGLDGGRRRIDWDERGVSLPDPGALVGAAAPRCSR